MLSSMKPSEFIQPLAKIDPASFGSVQNSAWVALNRHTRVAVIISVGLVAAGGTFDAKLQKATDGSGTNAVDITSRNITQLADTADNITLMLQARAEELGQTAGGLPYTHIRLVATPAVAATIFGALLLGVAPTNFPVVTTGYTQIIG